MEELSDMSELPLLLEEVDMEEEIPSELWSEDVDEISPSEQPAKSVATMTRTINHFFTKTASFFYKLKNMPDMLGRKQFCQISQGE